jgi:hypothetical protein
MQPREHVVIGVDPHKLSRRSRSSTNASSCSDRDGRSGRLGVTADTGMASSPRGYLTGKWVMTPNRAAR